jgi:phage terminase large subunit-like protein
MESRLIHGEGDLFAQPYRLLDWHKEFLWRWYELDPASPAEWWYQEALVGAERGASKTEFVAAIAMLEFAGPAPFRRPTPIVHVAAASYDQAGELFRQCQIMAGGQGGTVPQAPLHGLCNVWDTEISLVDGSPGKIERIAAVAGTNEGGKTTLFAADEAHEWTGNKARVHIVITAALTKRMTPGRSITLSTAGAGRGQIPPAPNDPLLWKLYVRGLLSKDDPGSRFLFDWREFPPDVDLHDPDQLRAALRSMRAPDVTWSVEVRAREFETGKMPEHEFLRYFGNRFVDLADDNWLIEHPHAWPASIDPAASIPDGTDVVVGIDMALRHDSVGVIVAAEHGDQVIWEPHHWAADPAGKIDFADVFQTIRGELADRFNIRAVTYDPRFFETQARLLEDEGLLMVEFIQSPERLVPADGHLFNLVVGGGLVVPDNPFLNAHSAAAAWRENDRGRYLSKGKAKGPMDLIRAGSMATWELTQPDDVGDAPLVMMIGGDG